MNDTNELLSKLNATTPTYVNVTSPRCLVVDDQGYLVTVSLVGNYSARVSLNNFTQSNLSISASFPANPFNLAQYKGAYYVVFDSYILVFNSSNMSLLSNISASGLSGARDVIFLNGGQTMIVASSTNNSLLFLNRTGASSYNYNLIGNRHVSYWYPHGLLYINDTFFYATSWGNNTVYAYSTAGNVTSWTEKLVLNASSVAVVSNGNHVSIDECGRYWFSLGIYGLMIFSSQGSLLGTLKPTGSDIFDAVISENYVIYLSDSLGNRIIHIDPNIQC